MCSFSLSCVSLSLVIQQFSVSLNFNWTILKRIQVLQTVWFFAKFYTRCTIKLSFLTDFWFLQYLAMINGVILVTFFFNKTRLSNLPARFEDLNLFLALQSRPREAGGKSTELDTNWFMNELASSSDYDILYVNSPLFPAKSHQRACKTIMCHLVTRSHSRKACKHTAIPSVTPGAVPLSLLRCHVLTWVCALLGASVCSATHLAWWLL